MERDKLEKFESWLAGELLLASLLGAATALFLTNPSLRSAYVAPQGRLVLDTTIVLAATIVAILFGVRFAVEARRLDLMLAAGFSVTAAGTLLFAIVPLVSGGPLEADEGWSALCSRILGAALIAVAPFVRGRSKVRRRGIWLTFGLLASALTGMWLLFQPVRNVLPSLQSGNERPIMLTVALALFLASSPPLVTAEGVTLEEDGRIPWSAPPVGSPSTGRTTAVSSTCGLSRWIKRSTTPTTTRSATRCCGSSSTICGMPRARP